jgi:hypothetical protein
MEICEVTSPEYIIEWPKPSGLLIVKSDSKLTYLVLIKSTRSSYWKQFKRTDPLFSFN